MSARESSEALDLTAHLLYLALGEQSVSLRVHVGSHDVVLPKRLLDTSYSARSDGVTERARLHIAMFHSLEPALLPSLLTLRETLAP